MDAPPAVQPDPRAPHSEWVGFAVSQGMDPEEARRRTRDQLRVCFLPSGGPIGSEPELERHDRDGAALTARHEARRRSWEQ